MVRQRLAVLGMDSMGVTSNGAILTFDIVKRDELSKKGVLGLLALSQGDECRLLLAPAI